MSVVTPVMEMKPYSSTGCSEAATINVPFWARPAILLKKRLWHWCFPVNFAKFLRTHFLQNTSGPLLLDAILHLYQERYAYSILSMMTLEFSHERQITPRFNS